MERNSRLIRRITGVGLITLTVASCLFLSGCKEEAAMTQTEKDNFKGGPMPPGFMDKNAPPKGPQ